MVGPANKLCPARGEAPHNITHRCFKKGHIEKCEKHNSYHSTETACLRCSKEGHIVKAFSPHTPISTTVGHANNMCPAHGEALHNITPRCFKKGHIEKCEKHNSIHSTETACLRCIDDEQHPQNIAPRSGAATGAEIPNRQRSAAASESVVAIKKALHFLLRPSKTSDAVSSSQQ